jgi:hypothetical protein
MRSDFLLFVSAVLYSSVSAAADLPDSLLDCSKEADETTRLACYDREISRIKQPAPNNGVAASVPEPAIITEDVVPTAEKTTTADTIAVGSRETVMADFGKDEQTLRSEREQEEGSIDEMHATLIAIAEDRQGKRIFTLDNDQVWAEKFVNKALRLETGDAVRIKSGALGSFRLFGSGKRSTKVERIR